MFQEMMQQQIEIERKEKMKRMDREVNSRVALNNSKRVAEDLKVLQICSQRASQITNTLGAYFAATNLCGGLGWNSYEHLVDLYTRGREKAEAEPTPLTVILMMPERLKGCIADPRNSCSAITAGSPAGRGGKTEPKHLGDEPIVQSFGGRNKAESETRGHQALTTCFVMNMTMEEVINEFDKLRMRCDVVEEEEQVVALFLGVLKPEIADINLKVDESADEFVFPDRGEAIGHPWQFDRKTKHDGFQNTYSFKKDGVNITLLPFDSRQTQAEGSNLFMKKTSFEGLMKTSPNVFTLVVVEENEIISEAPLQVQPLLREFADVIPDDIPLGLPAMRDI
ncbi:hypothetical protein Tco_0842509 [Tanacetum coccineum]|uniref:Reverse transcriptase domain-containing protein n=1 Tax=Tanacetum coccineum TaxID=301880 RepID=A0ABQ5B263_9ASTR